MLYDVDVLLPLQQYHVHHGDPVKTNIMNTYYIFIHLAASLLSESFSTMSLLLYFYLSITTLCFL